MRGEKKSTISTGWPAVRPRPEIAACCLRIKAPRRRGLAPTESPLTRCRPATASNSKLEYRGREIDNGGPAQQPRGTNGRAKRKQWSGRWRQWGHERKSKRQRSRLEKHQQRQSQDATRICGNGSSGAARNRCQGWTRGTPERNGARIHERRGASCGKEGWRSISRWTKIQRVER